MWKWAVKEQATGKTTWGEETWEPESKVLNRHLTGVIEGLQGCLEVGPGFCVALVKAWAQAEHQGAAHCLVSVKGGNSHCTGR